MSTELNEYLKGLRKGQLLTITTVRNMIASEASLKTMSNTLDLIEKQLGGNDE